MKITAITFAADHMTIGSRPVKHLRLGRHPWLGWEAHLEGDICILANRADRRAYRIGVAAAIVEVELDADGEEQAGEHRAGPGRGHKGPRG